jgi:predicted nucleic acid-binding protein
VADASALVAFVSSGLDVTPFDDALRPESELHIPEICDVEVVSALRRSVFRGAMSADDMRLLITDFVDLPLRRHRHLPLLGRAFELRENITAADAMYVALAERLDASLLTADRRLARAVKRHTAVSVLP